MKISSEEFKAVLPYLAKAPVLTITLASMVIIAIAIKAIVELNTTSILLLVSLITCLLYTSPSPRD